MAETLQSTAPLETVKRLDGLSSQYRLEWRTFVDDSEPIGYMTRHTELPLILERTSENYHLFLYNPKTFEFELSYPGSGIIASMLEGRKAADQLPSKPSERRGAREGRMAFFDVHGKFYNLARFVDVELVSGDDLAHNKHVATFDVPETGNPDINGKVLLPVDDIYTIGGAQHPITWITLGGDNS